MTTSEKLLPELGPCPFCGGNDLGVEEIWQSNDAVKCKTCWSWGPIFKGADRVTKAIQAWNRRSEGWQPIETAPKWEDQVEK